ncbi:MAG: Fpg/Nei family DNA glycosylase [Pseudomonadota bacterium]
MPELPDLTVYLDALASRISGEPLRGIRIANPFVLRSVDPTPEQLVGLGVTGFQRLGKRLVINLEDDCFIVIHLMIAGRLRWRDPGAKLPGRLGLAGFDFDPGTLVLTEASQKHRASVHLVRGRATLRSFDPGGKEFAGLSLEGFVAALSQENHTLKRALTDQRFIAGIGNAYSDEILHRARLSPMRQVRQLSEAQWQALYLACGEVLAEWTARLRREAGDAFPEKVTAFHAEMAVHGRYRSPCPDCGKPVQRIRYATNECNYCAVCQNQGNLLADRALSRLLKKDWPRRLEDLD